MTRRLIVTIILIILAASAVYLRGRHLTTYPGWFRDEGTYYSVAKSMGEEPPRVGAINCTFGSPFMTHPPLYFYLNNLWFKITGDSIQSFRRFAVLCNFIIMLFIFLIACKMDDGFLGVMTLAIFIFNPLCLFFSRMSLPYHLYGVFAVLTYYCVLYYVDKPVKFMKYFDENKGKSSKRTVWMILACLTASFSLLTVYYSWIFIVYLLFVIISQKRYSHISLLGIIPVPIAIFLLFSYLNRTPGLYEDFSNLMKANKTGSPLEIFQHFREFLNMGVIFILGPIGLFMFRKSSHSISAFFIMLFMAFIVLIKKDTMISFINYPVIPLLPFLALGTANFFKNFIINHLIGFSSDIESSVFRKLFITIAVFLIIVSMFFYPIYESFSSIHNGFKSPLEFGMVKNTGDAYQTAAKVNSLTDKNSLVLATSNLWWLLDTPKYSDIFQSESYRGVKWDFYLYDIAKARYLYNPQVNFASIIVIDNFTNLKAGRVDNYGLPNAIDDTLTRIEQTWIKAGEYGEYKIYKNPSPGTLADQNMTTDTISGVLSKDEDTTAGK